MSAKDRKWEMKALGRLLSLKNSLINDMHLGYLILDTSPGLQYSSINAIVSADAVLVVTSIDRSDIKGTRRMIQELYELFDKKAGIVMNKVPMEILSSGKEKGNFFKRFNNLHNLPIIGAIPCFCDVLRAGGTYIFTDEKPEHPFTEALEEIAAKIEKL
jgi:septum site-determining protein MinD